MPPPDETRRGPAPYRPALPHTVEISTPDDEERTAIRRIIEDLRATLPTPTPAERAWNEQARNRAEFAAWVNGRRRVCDLVGSDG